MSAEPPPEVRYERHATLPDVALVTLSNPGKLNAVNVAMWRALRAIFDGLAEREPLLRCVIAR